MSGPVLRTERLLLRLATFADLEAVARIYDDPEVIRYLEPARFADGRSRSWLGEVLARPHPEGMGVFAVEYEGEVVGRVNLRPSTELPAGLIEVGWYLARPYWGRGLALEAMTALVGHGFDRLGVPALWALVPRENASSVRLAERLGFVPVGSGHYYFREFDVHVLLPDGREPAPGERSNSR
ncbi:hypothetical protein GCM10012275_45840 [Longimycelium tulufanense]|uniref:N-acetyltransferase domain-containing protein n=1 Tax=Longimycelium tulufanense TaxID=907463 RepID=A0A8J3CJ74_9PSEU|nr:GNAT family N-acetyltransferase [Longimycelium tulufanense]GGM70271.1 hypothetical protein GCM10012275_45840 [Longimycelium tulufanense]